MLTEDQRARVTLVLVRARNPNNIGAVARAMHGFGFKALSLVNDYPVSLEQARSAVDASAILTAASSFATVADAITGCSLVVGTTAVGERKREHPLYTLAQGGPLIASASMTGRVALLFGSEKTGLTNDALSHCNWLMTIPMHATPGMRHASMNLGQAVSVCLYELIRDANLELPLPAEAPRPAPAGDLERLTAVLADTLSATGYERHRPSFADPPALRRMIRRLNLSQSDARRWIGILRRLLWKLNE
jgi:TrmH family RNA methyltransferase